LRRYLIVAPPLAQAYGWRAVWWFGAIYALAVTVLYLVVVRPAPLDGVPAPADGHPDGASVSSKQVLRNRNIWLLAAAFAGFIAVVIGSSTYLPTFLATQRGIPLSQAALLAAIPTLVTIFSAPGGGILSDRIGSRKKPYLVGIALAIVLAPLAWVATGPGLIVVLVVTGLASGLVPMAIFSAAVEASGHERQGGMAMAIIMVGQNAGLLLGPIVFGTLGQSVGWTAAFASIAVMAALGLLAGWLAKVR
jgi:nitrate/nitrite transporter NarK